MENYFFGISIMAILIFLAVRYKLPEFNSLESLRRVVIIIGLICLSIGLLTRTRFMIGAGAESTFLYFAIRYPQLINLPTLEEAASHEFGIGIFALAIGLIILAL
jgi:hypothetical protein